MIVMHICKLGQGTQASTSMKHQSERLIYTYINAVNKKKRNKNMACVGLKHRTKPTIEVEGCYV